LKVNAAKEAIKAKAASPAKEVKKLGPPVAQNATHEVVPVVVEEPKE
jgi:hypothetical protein